jgi:CubicO group peptidase (beta-lactamase class C family)
MHQPLAVRFSLLLLLLFGPLLGVLSAQVTGYHDVSSATHQAQFTSLSGQGYRLVSLSVAGGLSAPRYSAVWELVGGPGWVSSHDMSLSQYATVRTTWINQGYRAKLITTAGTGGNRVIAAVFVSDGASVYDSTSLAATSLGSVLDTQRGQGRIPCSIDTFEDTLGNAYYCLVCEPNPTGIVWGHDLDETAADFTTTRIAHGEGGERLACLGMSDSQRYASVWYDQRVGTENLAHNQSGSGWQTQFNVQTGNGLFPRIIASGGVGAAHRTSGSFAQYRTPQVRLLTTTGTYRSQFAAVDTYMTGLVTSQQARAASIAIARDGKLVYARAFTRAESGYPITQPTDAFRIASCTKPITAIATHQLDEMGLVTMSTRPQSVLGLAYSDTRFDNIELRHILEYTSGIDRNYDPWTIANWQNPSSPVLPVGLTLGTQWLADQAMMFAPTNPPTYYRYSNSAWMLAAEVIRVRSGQTFMAFLQSQVFGPLGITRIRVAPSEFAQLTANDVMHHLDVLDLDASERYTDRRRRSAQYAQDLEFKRASGGLASSSVDYVRFLSGIFDLRGADAIVLDSATVDSVLARHAYTEFNDPTQTQNICLAGMSWTDRGNGVHSYGKGGSLENASASVAWRTDGVSFAVFVDKGDAGANSESIHGFIEAVTNWPDVDEFPTYGLPAFQRLPEIETPLLNTLNNVTSGYFALQGKRLDTVTQVNFGSMTIGSTSPSQWQNGYFVITSPTSMRVYPPQGRFPTTYALSVENAVGVSNSVSVTINLGTSFRIGAPTVVLANQAWSAYVGRGTSSGLTQPGGLVILCVSTSNLPSSAPGIVSLGLGNAFTDLLTSGAQQFNVFTSTTRFDLPPLPIGSSHHLEAVGLDVTAPSIFPLLTTNTVQVTRQ